MYKFSWQFITICAKKQYAEATDMLQYLARTIQC